MTIATQELLWLKRLIRDIKKSCISKPVKLFNDNQSAMKLAQSNNYHARSKHIDTKYNFLKGNVLAKVVRLEYVNSKEMVVDALTKTIRKGQIL